MKFLVPNYSCLQNPWLGGYGPPDPRSLYPLSSTEFVEPPPPQQNSWVRHWALVIQNAMRMRQFVICDMPGSTVFIHIVSKTAQF